MKERLLNILDQSTCLTRRQMRDYLGGIMLPEEIHAAETHIASCPLCNMALEGFEAHTEEGLEAIASLNSGFLKEHFDSITPQIHLNSIAPAVSQVPHPRKKTAVFPFLKAASVAAALLVGFGIFWLLDRSKNNTQESGMIASNEPVQAITNTANSSGTDRQAGVAKTGKEVAANQKGPAAVKADNIAAPSLADRKQGEVAQRAEVAAAAGTENTAAAKMKGNNSEQLAYEEEGPQRKAAWANADSANRSRRSVASPVDNSGDDAKNITAAMKQRPPAAAPEAVAAMAKKETAAADEEEVLASADELYGEGNYKAAVSKYNRAMKTGDKNSRAEATVMAAKCYRNMGEKAKAIALLQELADKDGPQRKTAQRLLDELTDK